MKPIVLNPKTEKKRALYLQIYDQLKEQILQGEAAAGEKLPSLRILSKNLEVSITTAELAYNQLLVEGYITSRPQSGYYVAQITSIQHGDKGKNGAYYFFWWKSPNGRWNIKNHLRYQYEGTIESSTETQENHTAGIKEENRIRKKLNNHWLLDELSTVYEFTPKTNIGINYSLNFSDRKPFTRMNYLCSCILIETHTNIFFQLEI